MADPVFVIDDQAQWKYRRIVDWEECPHLLDPAKKLERDNAIKLFGEDSPFIQSYLRGRWARSEDIQRVFTQLDLEAVQRAMEGLADPIPGQRRASIDFSGGGDKSVLMLSEGSDVKLIKSFNEKNEIKLARKFVEWFRENGILPRDVYGDAGGLGATCITYMETDLHFMGIRKYLNNQRAKFPKRFMDRNSEDHWRLKRLLLMGQVKLPGEYKQECATLLTQMRKRRYNLLDAEKVKLEPKPMLRRRGEDSPDHLDALVMLMSDIKVHGFGEEEEDEPWDLGDWKPHLDSQKPKHEVLGEQFKQKDKRTIGSILKRAKTRNPKKFFRKSS